MRAITRFALVVVLGLAPACSAGRDSATTATLRVAAADTSCSVDRAEIPTGTIEVAVTNHGTIITEVYLYAAHDRAVGEVENVEPGATAVFTVVAGAGGYEVACKPGQLGDGIRTPVRIVGEPDVSNDAPVDDAAARGVSSFAFEMHVTGDRFAPELADLVVVRGQTITFRLHNEAGTTRGFAVLGPDGASLGAAEAAPGESATVRVTFAVTGTYTAVDPAVDHRTNGAEASFRVVD